MDAELNQPIVIDNVPSPVPRAPPLILSRRAQV